MTDTSTTDQVAPVNAGSAESGAAPEPTPRSTTDLLRRHVAKRVAILQGALLESGSPHHSSAVATLARLRRSQPGDVSDPAVWDVVFAGTPPRLVGTSDEPSRAERAMHAALVLFASHIQSADGPRHVPKRRLGHAIGDLARADGSDDYADGAVARRFRAFATATNWPSAVRHLRGLLSLMRSQRISVDYGALAVDLYRMQDPKGLRRSRLQWARDFHRIPPRQTSTEPSADLAPQEN